MSPGARRARDRRLAGLAQVPADDDRVCWLRRWDELAEQSVRLVARSGAEPQGGGAATGGGAGLEGPQTLDDDPLAMRVAKLADEVVTAVCADLAVAEVADQ